MGSLGGPANKDTVTLRKEIIYPDGALRQRQLHLRQTVAVGRDRAQGRRLGGAGGVQIDAVEVVARLLGRDRELGLVDQPFEVGGADRERSGSSRRRRGRENRFPGASAA